MKKHYTKMHEAEDIVVLNYKFVLSDPKGK